jgi:hypothetical protein
VYPDVGVFVARAARETTDRADAMVGTNNTDTNKNLKNPFIPNLF